MSTPNETHIRVDLGSRSYDIIIGDKILSHLGTYIEPLIGSSRVHIVTDENVYALYGPALEALSIDYKVSILPAGENQKSFETLQKVLNSALQQGLGRHDVFIAFGGGVIGDLTGFAASIYKRGCRFVQIPTTLLAQVDSSVGGKTAINVMQGKNLIGAFHQPSLVLSDTSVLASLPDRQIKAGYAEILKYGLLGDAAFFEWLEKNGQDVLNLSPTALAYAIAISCKTKARIVAEDELERGARALLNLGHTFGHALEAEAGYAGDLLHGEAVSVGMDMAFAYSAQLGVCSADDARRVNQHLAAMNMPRISSVEHLIHPDSLMKHMAQDKKNEAGRLTLILAKSIGHTYIDSHASRDAVHSYFQKLQSEILHNADTDIC